MFKAWATTTDSSLFYSHWMVNCYREYRPT